MLSLTASLAAFIISRLMKDDRCPMGEDRTSSTGLKLWCSAIVRTSETSTQKCTCENFLESSHKNSCVPNLHFRILVVGWENLDLAKISHYTVYLGTAITNWVALGQGLGTMTHWSHYHLSETFLIWHILYQTMLIKNLRSGVSPIEFPALGNVTPPYYQWHSQISAITGHLVGMATCYHEVNFDPGFQTA